jgi:hypothetical protein
MIQYLLISFTVLCWILAGVFNAIGDTLQFHFDISVFKRKNPKFWNPLVSCDYAKKIPLTKYRIDAWHLACSLEIICLAGAMVLHGVTGIVIATKNSWIGCVLELGIAGALYNYPFNLFFDKILKANKV